MDSYEFQKYNSLGGWLLFVLISSCLSILVCFSTISETLSLNWGEIIVMKYLSVVINLIIIIVSVLLIYIIVARPKNAVKKILQVQYIILAVRIIAVIADYLVASSYSLLDRMDITSSFATPLFSALLFAGIWITYFKRSRRVAVYFGMFNQGDIDSSSFN